MADDDDLNEDEFRLPTNERLKQSRKQRSQQLKRYAQHEKQLEKENGKRSKKQEKPANRKADKKVQFPGSVTLLEAAARNDKNEVRRLLQMGISPDVCNDDGLTALHQCCIDDAGDMVNLLLEFGASVNATDCELWTPLHAAATCGRTHLCRSLIERGADLLAVNGDGNMPYDICDHEATLDHIEYEMAKQGITQDIIDQTRLIREKKMLDDLKDLHHRHGNLEFRGRNGETPLHVAAANGYVDVAEFLLTCRVRVDSLDDDNWQPIHCAACWGQLAVLELLLEYGASLEAKTSSGATPIDICDDNEMKQKILEIKEEIEKNRLAKSRELSRRHSSTVRSASVRRTSMREKNEMSWKEAKEEARRMRESAEMLGRVDGEDDENRRNDTVPPLPAKEKVPKSILLTPLVSMDEALDEQNKNSNTNSSYTARLGSNFNENQSPQSPELIGRGGISLSPPSKAEELKINGLPTTPQGVESAESPLCPVSTLPELKKQRSYNRLPDARLNDINLDTGMSQSSETLSLDKSVKDDSVKLPTRAPKDSSKSFFPSTGKPSTRRVELSRTCCVII